MQLNEIGSNHGAKMHQVTNCMHDRSVSGKKGGAAMSSASSATGRQQLTEQSKEGFSLTDWMKNILSGARGLWGKIWGGTQAGETALESSNGVKTDSAGPQELPTPMSNVDENRASIAVSQPVPITNNPYFSAIEDTGRQQQTLWQKVKVKFQNISGYLTRRFSFSNRNAFQAKQERPKEDLTRRSRFRKDDLEIDCVLTDESYLMDSYNKKGEYSTLSADKNKR